MGKISSLPKRQLEEEKISAVKQLKPFNTQMVPKLLNHRGLTMVPQRIAWLSALMNASIGTDFTVTRVPKKNRVKQTEAEKSSLLSVLSAQKDCQNRGKKAIFS